MVEEAIEVFGRIGYRGTVLAIALAELGSIAGAAGDTKRAAGLFGECLELCLTGRYLWVLPYALEGLGDVAIARGRPEQGARLFGAAEAHRAETGAAVRPTVYPEYRSAQAAARARLSEPAFAAAWAQGRTLTLDQAASEAMAIVPSPPHDPVPPGSPVAPPIAPAPTPAPAPTHADRFGLSPREREVLGLIAQRLSNPEIAARLHVSPRTVQSHAISLFGKLGVADRRAAAALAAKHGLA